MHDGLQFRSIDLLQSTTLLVVEREMRGNDLRFYREIIGVAVYMFILCCVCASI